MYESSHPKATVFCRAGAQPSESATFSSSSHRSADDPISYLGTPSLDLRLVRVNKDPQPAPIPLKRTGLGDRRGGVNVI
jgi:hypothetical protein